LIRQSWGNQREVVAGRTALRAGRPSSPATSYGGCDGLDDSQHRAGHRLLLRIRCDRGDRRRRRPPDDSRRRSGSRPTRIHRGRIHEDNRRHRDSFSLFRHVANPILGSLTLVVPFVELCKPGQPAPYSEFPFIALAIPAVAVVLACLVVHRHPLTGAGGGSSRETERSPATYRPCRIRRSESPLSPAASSRTCAVILRITGLCDGRSRRRGERTRQVIRSTTGPSLVRGAASATPRCVRTGWGCRRGLGTTRRRHLPGSNQFSTNFARCGSNELRPKLGSQH
jgi:hypothetical protein